MADTKFKLNFNFTWLYASDTQAGNPAKSFPTRTRTRRLRLGGTNFEGTGVTVTCHPSPRLSFSLSEANRDSAHCSLSDCQWRHGAPFKLAGAPHNLGRPGGPLRLAQIEAE